MEVKYGKSSVSVECGSVWKGANEVSEWFGVELDVREESKSNTWRTVVHKELHLLFHITA